MIGLDEKKIGHDECVWCRSADCEPSPASSEAWWVGCARNLHCRDRLLHVLASLSATIVKLGKNIEFIMAKIAQLNRTRTSRRQTSPRPPGSVRARCDRAWPPWGVGIGAIPSSTRGACCAGLPASRTRPVSRSMGGSNAIEHSNEHLQELWLLGGTLGWDGCCRRPRRLLCRVGITSDRGGPGCLKVLTADWVRAIARCCASGVHEKRGCRGSSCWLGAGPRGCSRLS